MKKRYPWISFFGPEKGRRIKIENEKVMCLAACIRYAFADTRNHRICRWAGAEREIFRRWRTGPEGRGRHQPADGEAGKTGGGTEEW